jgi:hypothetical protein
MSKYDTLNTVAHVCEWRKTDFEDQARQLIAVLENEQDHCPYQEIWRPIHDPWARTYVAKLAEMYMKISEMFEDLAAESERVALED